MKLAPVLHELHHSEVRLGRQLLLVSERHAVDHEIHHVARDISEWSRRHLRRMAEVGVDYGLDLDPAPRLESGPAARVREKGSELIGRLRAPELLMLEDLRNVYVDASGVQMDWLLLAQAAQGVRHMRLLELAEECQPETHRQAKWAEAQLKAHATQILVS